MTIPAIADQLAGLEAQMTAARADWAAAADDERQAYAAVFAASARADQSSVFITTALAIWRRLRVQVDGYEPSTEQAAALNANYEAELAEELVERRFRAERAAGRDAARERMIAAGG